MPIVNDDAIVLTRYPFGERSAVAVFLTKSRGLVRALVRHFPGRRTAVGVLEPLAQVRLTMFMSPRRELATADDVEVTKSWLELTKNPLSWAAALVAAELALELCPAGTPQQGFYRLLEKAPSWLEQGADPRLAVLYMLLWATKLSGIFPDVTACSRCQRPLAGGPARYLPGIGFACLDHGGEGLGLSTTSILFLREALGLPLDRLSRPPGNELVTVLISILRQYLEKDLRSLSVFWSLAKEMRVDC